MNSDGNWEMRLKSKQTKLSLEQTDFQAKSSEIKIKKNLMWQKFFDKSLTV